MTGYKKHAALADAMERGIQEGVYPGAVLLVLSGGQRVHLSSHGRTSKKAKAGRITSKTTFDLASLTKILATTPLVMDLIQRGRMNLGDRVSRYLPGFRGRGRGRITIRNLLEHSSGLADWRPYFQEVAAFRGGAILATRQGRDAVRAMVSAEVPRVPPGKHASYSDLGFILLDQVIQRAEGKTLDGLFRMRIAKRLALSDLFFIDLTRPASKRAVCAGRVFAATERCPWRGRTLVAEVHDDNAWAMGGVSGHAGLFGDAHAVADLAQAWLDSFLGRASLFDHRLVQRFWTRSEVPGSTRALGFDTPSRGSSSGSRFGPRSVGHTGFTGTSLWIDPDRELVVVLLTNRVHPTRDNQAIRSFRPWLHDRVCEVMGAQ